MGRMIFIKTMFHVVSRCLLLLGITLKRSEGASFLKRKFSFLFQVWLQEILCLVLLSLLEEVSLIAPEIVKADLC